MVGHSACNETKFILSKDKVIGAGLRKKEVKWQEWGNKLSCVKRCPYAHHEGIWRWRYYFIYSQLVTE